MGIDFGKVKRYNKDRGFGFISHTFVDSSFDEVFFHIKTVKRTHTELAQVLNAQDSIETLFFWYEYETSEKGQQVVTLLDPLTVKRSYVKIASILVNIIEESWMNMSVPISDSLKKATFDFLPLDRSRQLSARRVFAEDERKVKIELQKVSAAKIQEAMDQKAAQERAEENEFCQLVAEMSAQKFTKSNEVSKYIVKHRLGDKYGHISGILQMRLRSDVWNFDGGFPPKTYARLCDELNLGNQHSEARAVKFTPYKDIKKP